MTASKEPNTHSQQPDLRWGTEHDKVSETSWREEDDRVSLNAWTAFLTEYAQGKTPPNPPRPPLSPSQLEKLRHVTRCEEPESFAEVPLYSSTTVTPSLARRIRDFYCDHGYLPPPRAPWEESRERCISEYDLYSERQITNIQAATDLIAAFFPDTLTTFSLFRDRIQTHFALSGPPEIIQQYQLRVGMRIPSEDSLCGHAVLLDSSMLFIPDLQADWRYRFNPFALAGFKSFVGVPVTLERDPLADETKSSELVEDDRTRIGIGTLNICFTRKHVAELDDTQQMVVNRLASMLETQIRATWEGDRRRRDARARAELSSFIEEAMIGDVVTRGGSADEKASLKRPSGRRQTSATDLAQSVAGRVRKILREADTVHVYDIRAFSSLNGEAQYFDSKAYPLRSLAVASDSEGDDIHLSPASVLSLLAADGPVYDKDNQSGLESFLPKDTEKHLALPLAEGDRPLYLILLTSTSAFYDFPPADITFVRNLGSILVAKSIQVRVMREDAAKTSFLSAISHELRTPMHAVTTSHSLMREAIAAGRTGDIDALLSLSESSSRTLTNILNDVLDFGKGTAGDLPEGRRQLVPDLVGMVVQIVKVAESQYVSESSDLSIAVESDVRDWAVNLDEARFQRVLINGLTNAMKFCPHGSILVRMTSLPDKVKIEIVDNGVGFDEADMPLVFQAFKKLDINTQGAGLGLHITKTMLEKAGGSLALRSEKGKGTTFEAVIPVSWAVSVEPDRDGAVGLDRRQIRPAKNASTASESRGVLDGRDWQKNEDPIERQSHKSTPIGSSTSHQLKPERHAVESLRVLIVDDNHICLKLLGMSLRRSPIRIDLHEAHDGAQAVEVFRKARPDLVLTDVCMPGLDGIAAAERMREFEAEEKMPRSAIYAVTALGATDPRSKSMGLNGTADLDGWLVKGQDLANIVRDIAQKLSVDLPPSS